MELEIDPKRFGTNSLNVYDIIFEEGYKPNDKEVFWNMLNEQHTDIWTEIYPGDDRTLPKYTTTELFNADDPEEQLYCVKAIHNGEQVIAYMSYLGNGNWDCDPSKWNVIAWEMSWTEMNEMNMMNGSCLTQKVLDDYAHLTDED